MSVSKLYDIYLKSSQWQYKRSERLRIDGYRCVNCGSYSHLQVHHLNYNNIYNEDVHRDLITLCDKCHKDIEEKKTQYKLFREENMETFKNNNAVFNNIANAFIAENKHNDIAFGGKYNFTNYNDLKLFWDPYVESFNWYGSGIERVKDYFLYIHYKKINQYLKAGLSKTDIKKKYGYGFNTINKAILREADGYAFFKSNRMGV